MCEFDWAELRLWVAEGREWVVLIDWSAWGTWAAVVVALFLPWYQMRRQRIEAEHDAMKVLPALAEELQWVSELAESAIRSARRELHRADSWSSDNTDVKNIDLLAQAEFPVFYKVAPLLTGASAEVVTQIHSTYGELARAKQRLRNLRERRTSNALKAVDEQAGAILATSRMAYRYIASIVDVEIPAHWEPGPHVRVIDED